MKQTPLIILSLLIVGIGSRLIPHYPNFTAVGAISLLGAAFTNRRSIAVIVPFLVMLISDMILNNLVYARMFPEDYKQFIFLHRGAMWSYAALGLIVIGSYTMFRGGVNLPKVLFGSLGASVIFFLFSNFGVWASGSGAYPVNFGGLMTCFAMGLPFFPSQLLGDLFYSVILFGIGVHVFALKPKRHLA